MPTVIKAGQAGQVIGRLTTVDLADHLREAQTVIAEARLRAAAMVSDAREEAVRSVANARAEGHRAGFELGMNEGRTQGSDAARREALAAFQTQQESLVGALSAALLAFEKMKTDLEIAARRDLLEFAVAMASKMTFAIGRLHREAAQENLRRAVALVAARTDIRVRVNPADRESMTQFAPTLCRELAEAGRVTIEVDDSVAAGGCRVHTSETDVDATLETQTAELVRCLLGERSAAAESVAPEGSHV